LWSLGKYRDIFKFYLTNSRHEAEKQNLRGRHVVHLVYKKFFCIISKFPKIYCYRRIQNPTNKKCGYDVPGMILLQTYLYTYSLLRGVTFKALPLSSYALSPVILPLLDVWNYCCEIAFSAVVTFEISSVF